MTITDETLEMMARAQCRVGCSTTCEGCLYDMRAALAAALPLIRAADAERIAKLERELVEAKQALAKIFAVGDGYGPNPNRRGEPAGTTGEGHAECRKIAQAAIRSLAHE